MTMKLGLHAMAVAATTVMLSGCGLAETTAVTAAQAEAAAKEAEEAKKTEEKVKRDIEAADQAAAEARDKAEQEVGQ
jgi:hypothetical protein